MFGELRFNRSHSLPLAAGMALALGVTACGSENLANSPPSYSRPYSGDPNAYGNIPVNWPNAIIADVQLPSPDTHTDTIPDVLVGFEKPGTDDWTVKDFPTDPTESGEFLLRIGPKPVEFEVRLRGPKGSAITKKAPKVTFEGPEPVTKAKKIPGIRLGGAKGWKQQF